MSGQVSGWLMRQGPRPDDVDRTGKQYGRPRARAMRAVLGPICDAANRDGEHAHPGNQAIEEGSLYGRSQMLAVLADLLAEGWLEVTEQGQGRGHATVYRVIVERRETVRSSDGPIEPNGPIPEPEPSDPSPGTVRSEEGAPLTPTSTQREEQRPALAGAPLVSWKVPAIVESGGRLREAIELCDVMAKLLRDRGHRVTAETSRSKGWVEPMEALLRLDGRDPADVARVLRWLDRGGDDVSAFWRVNVLSPNKLRMHWDRMREQYQRAVGPRPSKTAAALGAGTGPDLADVLAGNKHQAIEGSARG